MGENFGDNVAQETLLYVSWSVRTFLWVWRELETVGGVSLPLAMIFFCINVVFHSIAFVVSLAIFIYVGASRKEEIFCCYEHHIKAIIIVNLLWT